MARLGEQVEALEADRARVEELASRLQTLEQQGGQAAVPEDVLARIQTLETARPNEELAGRVEQLEQALSSGAQGGGPDPEQVRQTQERIARLEDELARVAEAAEGARADLAPLQQQLADLTSQVSTVGQRTQELAQTLTNDSNALKQQVSATQLQLQALSQRVGAGQQQLQALGEQVGGIGSRLQEAIAARERGGSLAVVVSQLEAAINQAEPYEETLQTLSQLGGEDQAVAQALSTLEPMADTGVPALPLLRQQFDQVEGEIIAAARGGEGLFEQAANNLRQLVTVRPVGAEAEGEDAAAVVARAQARLQEGDLAAAVQEVEQLAGEAAQAAQPWLDQARARLAAEEAVSALQARTAELLTSAR